MPQNTISYCVVKHLSYFEINVFVKIAGKFKDILVNKRENNLQDAGIDPATSLMQIARSTS